MTRFVFSLSAIVALVAPASSRAAEARDIDKVVRPFLQKHCVECHDAEVQKGEFRVDNLSPKVGTENTPQWLEIMERINTGEMPPKKVKVRPGADESAKVVEWIAGGGFKHAGHVAYDRNNNRPLSNLYVRMLHQMAIEADKFGTSTGVISDIG